MVLGLGRRRWGLFDALVAEEEKPCITLGLMGLDTKADLDTKERFF